MLRPGIRTKDVLTMLATVRAAMMCDLTASLPYWRFFLPWLHDGNGVSEAGGLESGGGGKGRDGWWGQAHGQGG